MQRSEMAVAAASLDWYMLPCDIQNDITSRLWGDDICLNSAFQFQGFPTLRSLYAYHIWARAANDNWTVCAYFNIASSKRGFPPQIKDLPRVEKAFKSVLFQERAATHLPCKGLRVRSTDLSFEKLYRLVYDLTVRGGQEVRNAVQIMAKDHFFLAPLLPFSEKERRERMQALADVVLYNDPSLRKAVSTHRLLPLGLAPMSEVGFGRLKHKSAKRKRAQE